jgi:replicative DNA helicase
VTDIYDEPPGDIASIERVPPNNIQAEQSVIGGMLLATSVIEEVAATCNTADFYRPAHATIYSTILDLYGQSRTPKLDPIILAAELDTRGELRRIGGAAYLHECVHIIPTAGNAPYYAQIVREYAQLRRLIEAGTRLVQIGYAAAGNVAEALDAAMAELQAAATGVNVADVRLSVADRWMGFIDELEAGNDPRALDTPWSDLNDVIELKPGQLITIGAATGGGKSLLGMNLAQHVALTRGKPVLVASMEMGGSELMARLTAAEAGINLDKLVRRRLDESDWQRIFRAADRMQNAHNFILDDTPNLTIGKVRARMRWMASNGQSPAMVVADYLQLMTPEKAGKGEKSRATEVAELSRGLKLLAMEFEIPVVALAQFNRNAVGRQPMVSDFKDSSAIEQDSNVIILMHRPNTEDGDGSDIGERSGEIDLIIAKNRNGASGRIVPLSFQGHYARLRSMARGI